MSICKNYVILQYCQTLVTLFFLGGRQPSLPQKFFGSHSFTRSQIAYFQYSCSQMSLIMGNKIISSKDLFAHNSAHKRTSNFLRTNPRLGSCTPKRYWKGVLVVPGTREAQFFLPQSSPQERETHDITILISCQQVVEVSGQLLAECRGKDSAQPSSTCQALTTNRPL